MIRIDENTSVEALLAEMPNLLSFSSNHNYHETKVAQRAPEHAVEWHQLETVEHYANTREVVIAGLAVHKEVVQNPSCHSKSTNTYIRITGNGTVGMLNFKFEHLVKENAYLHCSEVTAQVTNKPMSHTLRGFGNNSPVVVYQV